MKMTANLNPLDVDLIVLSQRFLTLDKYRENKYSTANRQRPAHLNSTGLLSQFNPETV
jgi:hypothetical protein